MWNNLSFTKNAFQDKRFDSVTVSLGIIVFVLTVYILRYRKNRKLPPGPIGLPIFGYYFFLRRKPIEKLKELAMKYGNVVGLYIGPKYIVFLNDWEAVKDGLGQNTTLDRPINLFEKAPYKFGFGGANGGEWLETRRLSMKVLKDGLKNNQWEDLIQEEMSSIVELITKKGGSPVEARSLFRDSFTNILVSLLIGDRLGAEHPTTKMVSRSMDFMMENLQTIKMVNFSETLTSVLRMIGLEEIPPFVEETRDILKFVSNTVDSNKFKSDANDTFISRFQAEVDYRKKVNEHTYVSEDNLKGSTLVLMVGGNETTRTSIIWALIAMADHPDKQKKVHEELDKVIGEDGSIRWSERSKAPYTLATILESMRWKTLVPLPAMRMVREDTQIQGYHIPKGTFLATNMCCLHNDPRYWEHPDQFIPERFLLEDGKKVNMSPDSFNAFSYGKRGCPGKLIAFMDMLQYFSTLMHRFEVMPKEGDKVKYEEFLGISYQAHNVELRLIPR